MPFSLGQILGGWRRKESKAQKARGKAPEISLTPSRKMSESYGGTARPHLEISSASPRASKSAATPTIKNKSELAWQTIIVPHISEKGGTSGGNQYIFKVTSGANKPVIKRAIEERYGVAVNAIHVINVPPKPRRRGQIMGEKSGFKKAVITLKEGQSITEF